MAYVTYHFRCSAGHEMDLTVAKAAKYKIRCPLCKHTAGYGNRYLRRVFTPNTNVIVPAYMKAPGSIGSTSEAEERDKAFKKSHAHRAQREQDERITARAESVEAAKDKHFQAAAKSPKLKQAHYDLEYAKATGQPI